ncbi:MAG TPA: HIT domain-containing protein [Actinomycetota bacterium]|nr:HIT domain-containing protein [Actinomycetota bacterium]
MERLWSPWRMQYLAASGDDDGCFLCAASQPVEDDAGVLHRGDAAFVMLNAFPYNTGHVMVAPVRHVGDLDALEPAERAEIMELTTRAVAVVRAAMDAHGFNVGMNLGRAAGAGVPGHLHVHVVPRWGGDTNFMPVVAHTKVLPEMLDETASKLRPRFARD